MNARERDSLKGEERQDESEISQCVYNYVSAWASHTSRGSHIYYTGMCPLCIYISSYLSFPFFFPRLSVSESES